MTTVVVRIGSAVSLFSMLVLAGCGGGGGDAPRVAPAGGVVLKEGQPLANVSVVFQPGSGPIASGTTDAQGRFTLMTSKPGDGATVGNHKVALSFSAPPPLSNSEEELAKAAAEAANSPVPAKYADVTTSGLTAEVKSDGKNDFTFEIKE